MKFYQRQKDYRYGARTVFLWKYKAESGRWKQRQVYWGNRETDDITRPIDGIKRIVELSDGLERRDLIRRTAWLNRGVDDYSDAHFSESIYLRLQDLKKQTPQLPKAARPVRPIRRSKVSIVPVIKKLLAMQGMKAPPEKLRALRESEKVFNTSMDLCGTEILRLANKLRELGQTWEALTGHQRFLVRDFVALRPSLSKGITANFCRLALATWRNHPEPFEDFAQAYGCAEKWWKLAEQDRQKST